MERGGREETGGGKRDRGWKMGGCKTRTGMNPARAAQAGKMGPRLARRRRNSGLTSSQSRSRGLRRCTPSLSGEEGWCLPQRLCTFNSPLLSGCCAAADCEWPGGGAGAAAAAAAAAHSSVSSSTHFTLSLSLFASSSLLLPARPLAASLTSAGAAPRRRPRWPATSARRRLHPTRRSRPPPATGRAAATAAAAAAGNGVLHLSAGSGRAEEGGWEKNRPESRQSGRADPEFRPGRVRRTPAYLSARKLSPAPQSLPPKIASEKSPPFPNSSLN